MAKRRRGRAQQSSDGGESSSDESERGVDELDVEGLRRKLRRQLRRVAPGVDHVTREEDLEALARLQPAGSP